MKRIAIKFTVIFSITFCVVVVACWLLDHGADTPWSYYVLAALAFAVPIAGIGSFIHGIVPKDTPNEDHTSKAAPFVNAFGISEPLAPLDPAIKQPGGSVLVTAVVAGVAVGLFWVIFAGWLSEIWRRPWPPQVARVGLLIMLVGSFALFSVAKVAAFLCRAQGGLRVLTIGMSSLLLFAATTGVIVGGGYTLRESILSTGKNATDPRFKPQGSKPLLDNAKWRQEERE